MAELEVSFEADIPKIVREGGKRTSKYDELLDKVKDRAQTIKGKNKVAVLSFDEQGKATSRYTSIKDAVSRREDADKWKVAVRQGENEEGETVYNLYMKWDPTLAEETSETETEEADDEDADF